MANLMLFGGTETMPAESPILLENQGSESVWLIRIKLAQRHMPIHNRVTTYKFGKTLMYSM